VQASSRGARIFSVILSGVEERAHSNLISRFVKSVSQNLTPSNVVLQAASFKNGSLAVRDILQTLPGFIPESFTILSGVGPKVKAVARFETAAQASKAVSSMAEKGAQQTLGGQVLRAEQVVSVKFTS